MNIIYSRRALADLEQIASYYSSHASPSVSDAIQRRFLEVIEHVRRSPEIAPRVAKRSEVRVIPVVRYPFQIFYRARGDTIDILHIRHTSRRPVDLDPRE
jgi:plasmid stabilization system protein ParE